MIVVVVVRYHEANGALELQISNLQSKQNGLGRQIDIERHARDRARAKVESIERELEDVVQHIQHPKMLKRTLVDMYHRHRQGAIADVAHSPNADDEFERYDQKRHRRHRRALCRQRRYLEKSVETLKIQATRDAKLQRMNAVRAMQQNSELIKEINVLRKRLGDGRLSERSTRVASHPSADSSAVQTELESHRAMIAQLRSHLEEKEERIQQLERSVTSRPVSRERLPPVPRS